EVAVAVGDLDEVDVSGVRDVLVVGRAERLLRDVEGARAALPLGAVLGVLAVGNRPVLLLPGDRDRVRPGLAPDWHSRGPVRAVHVGRRDRVDAVDGDEGVLTRPAGRGSGPELHVRLDDGGASADREVRVRIAVAQTGRHRDAAERRWRGAA